MDSKTKAMFDSKFKERHASAIEYVHQAKQSADSMTCIHDFQIVLHSDADIPFFKCVKCNVYLPENMEAWYFDLLGQYDD